MKQDKDSHDLKQKADSFPSGQYLTSQEQIPVLVLHVDVDNAIIISTRCAKDVASTTSGDFLGVSASHFVSHILADATWGTVNPSSGEWLPVGCCYKIRTLSITTEAHFTKLPMREKSYSLLVDPPLW